MSSHARPRPQAERQTGAAGGRSPEDVIASHLRLRDAGELDRDLEANYSPDIVVIDRHRVYRGHAGVRESAAILTRSVPGARFEYDRVLTCGDLAYLVWRAVDGRMCAQGVDSFIVRDGKIEGQTIYYHVERTNSPDQSA